MTSAQDIQGGVATIIALKSLYDTFYPAKKEEPQKEEPKPMHVVIDKEIQTTPEVKEQELRKQAYLGLNNLQLANMDNLQPKLASR